MSINIKPSRKGLLHKELGVKKGKKIPAAALAKAASSKNPVLKKRAVFAENAKRWNHAEPGSAPHPKMHTSKDN